VETLKLRGNATSVVDAKGRASLPAKYRKQLLPGDFIITTSLQEEFKALALHRADDFDDWIDEKIAANSTSARDTALIIDKFYSCAEEVRVDGVGRILIPADLREYAGITNEVVFYGARDHLELQSPEVWKSYRERLNAIDGFELLDRKTSA
jgi:MraZ protein